MKAKQTRQHNQVASNGRLVSRLTIDLQQERLFVQFYSDPPVTLKMFRGPKHGFGYHIVDLPCNSISDATNLLLRMGYHKPYFENRGWGAEATLLLPNKIENESHHARNKKPRGR